VSCVPINPDYRPAEIAYLLEHSEAELLVCVETRITQVEAGMAELSARPGLYRPELSDDIPPARTPPPLDGPPSPASEASLLYTSGTTGRPKGCILSHDYELSTGHWYATRGGLMSFRPEGERLYNPLPLYHVNSGTITCLAMMLTGGCQIQPDRFSPSEWWREVAQTEASIVHYLGVVGPMLLNQPDNDWEHRHQVRIGAGAGMEPQLHSVFEARFGFPMVELWGMTEMVRVLADCHEPRCVGTRAMGRPMPGLDAMVVDENDKELPRGEVGEMVVRHSAETPRKWAFSGYLKDEAATEEGWRGGWFHTGDGVRQDESGMLYFVDRRKNIIRRSGENIAAAEVEAVLQTNDAVQQVAVMAAPDEVREEEVMACLVLMPGHEASAELARQLFDECFDKLAYFKAPGWMMFLEDLPKTGSQKIQKHRIFEAGSDPRSADGVLDFRDLKKRARQG
jgi:crotonobetaine/carnitine-CoA ligase